MITLNKILKGLKYETESDFKNLYEYFLDFEMAFRDPNYLTDVSILKSLLICIICVIIYLFKI